MAARWTQRELTTLLDNLSDGFPVQQMIELLHQRRTEDGIISQAWKRNYGIKTSKVDGITRFYSGIPQRSREASNPTTEASQATVAQMRHLEPETRIIAYDGLSVNTLAVQILTENNLSVDPDIVYTLSSHILKEQQ